MFLRRVEVHARGLVLLRRGEREAEGRGGLRGSRNTEGPGADLRAVGHARGFGFVRVDDGRRRAVAARGLLGSRLLIEVYIFIYYFTSLFKRRAGMLPHWMAYVLGQCT